MKFILIVFVLTIASHTTKVLAKNPRVIRPVKKSLATINYAGFVIDKSAIIELYTGDDTDLIENGDIVSIDKNDHLFVAVRDRNNELTFELLDNDFRELKLINRPCWYNGKIYAHGKIIAVDPGKWLMTRSGLPVMLRPGSFLVCKDGTLHSHEIVIRY